MSYVITKTDVGIYAGLKKGKPVWVDTVDKAKKFDEHEDAEEVFEKLLAMKEEDGYEFNIIEDFGLDDFERYHDTGLAGPYHRMRTWTVVSQDDGNNTFTVEAKTAHDAAIVALGALGWSVSAEPEDDEDEEAEDE